jgi:hypothetical protein
MDARRWMRRSKEGKVALFERFLGHFFDAGVARVDRSRSIDGCARSLEPLTWS